MRWHLYRRCFRLSSALSGRYIKLFCAKRKGLNPGLDPWREGQRETIKPTNDSIAGTLNCCGEEYVVAAHEIGDPGLGGLQRVRDCMKIN